VPREQRFVYIERKSRKNKRSFLEGISSQLNERSFLLTECSEWVILDRIAPRNAGPERLITLQVCQPYCV